MYLMNIIIERAHATDVLRVLNKTTDPALARAIMKGELPPFLTALLSEGELDQLNDRLQGTPAPSRKIWITMKDLRALKYSYSFFFVPCLWHSHSEYSAMSALR